MDQSNINHSMRKKGEMLDGITIHERLNNATNGSSKEDISENHVAQRVERVRKNEIASYRKNKC